MALKLTITEQKRIFYSLLHNYPEHEKNRNLAKIMFPDDPEKTRKAVENIIVMEKRDYNLIVKIGKEFGQEIPEYKEINVEDYLETKH